MLLFMILTTHVLTSTVLNRYIARSNPFLAFFWGWLSHYLADSLPHVDYNLNSLSDKGAVKVARRKKISDYARVGLDALIGSLISYWLIWPENWYQVFYWMAVVAGGVIPDFLHYVNDILEIKIPVFLTKFHEGVHTKIKLRHTHPYWGGLAQLAICFVAIYFSR